MFGLPLPTVVIIVVIAGLALSMIPWQKLAELKASEPVGPIPVPVRPGSEQDIADKAPGKYLEAQKKLLEIRSICKDCPEATAAIDAAIRATVAMVVKPKTERAVGDVIGTAQIVKAAPLPPRTVDVEAGQ